MRSSHYKYFDRPQSLAVCKDCLPGGSLACLPSLFRHVLTMISIHTLFNWRDPRYLGLLARMSGSEAGMEVKLNASVSCCREGNWRVKHVL